MPRSRAPSIDVTPALILHAYSIGLFPMAESAEDPDVFWVDPAERGIFPLDGCVVSRSLAKVVRSEVFEIRVDHDFDAVIAGCAAQGPGRSSTWISGPIRSLYRSLFDQGRVHTIEAYRDDVLAGGLYGVSIGGAFFGESMFHRRTDASKVCLVQLVALLISGGYQLLDAQFVTPHLATLGAVAIARDRYRLLLADAIKLSAVFNEGGRTHPVSGREALRIVIDAHESAKPGLKSS